MSTQQKPLRMADLPGTIYRCPDEHVQFKPRTGWPNSNSTKLRELEIDEDIVIPKSSGGLVSRISKMENKSFRTQTEGTNLRVTRIK